MRVYEQREEEISEQIVDFLKKHDFLSLNRIETTLKLPQALLAKAISGERRIPTNHQWTLILALADYGLKIDNCILEVDEREHILLKRQIPDSKVEIKEVKEKEIVNGVERDANYFIYKEQQFRSFAAEYHDLL